MAKPQGQRRPEAKKAKNTSVAKRIRDVKRLLSKDTIDMKMRQSLEKKLALLEQESAENKTRLREQKYAVRYHKVRFFERIKLERRIHKLQRALKQGVEVEEARRELARTREDLEYVLHFPKGEKYVSLLKDAEDAEAQAHLEQERDRLRALVKHQLRDDAIVNELNEGKTRASDDEDALGDTAGGFAQELEEDEFFANSSDEERDPSASDTHSGDVNGKDDSTDANSDEGGHDEAIASARASADSDVDSSEATNTSGMSDASDSDGNDDARNGVEEAQRAFQKQQTTRSGPPKTKQKLRPEKGGLRDSMSKANRASMGKKSNVKAKPPKKGQPLRTRAEGGRRRRPKKK